MQAEQLQKELAAARKQAQEQAFHARSLAMEEFLSEERLQQLEQNPQSSQVIGLFFNWFA